MLIVVVILSTVILFVPSVTAEKAKQSAWIVPMVASFAGVVTLWLVTRLGRRFPSYPLPQYSQIILGKVFGKLLVVWYSLFFIFASILVVHEFIEAISITMLPETPPLAISLALMLVGVYATSKGIEVIARMNQFIFPLLLVSLMVVFILSWFKMDLDRLLPLLEEGMKPVLAASWIPASWYGEVIFIAFIFPQINKPKEVLKKGLIGLLLAAGLMVIMILVTIAIFGSTLTSIYTFPFWSTARYLEFGKYIQRMESLLLIIWISSMVIKISLFIYLSNLTLTQLLPIKFKTALYPLGAMVVIASVYGFKNIEQFVEILTGPWPLIALISEIGFPFLLVMVALFRGKKEGASS